jgi:tetratricopeptide (TPR) repeat protein
MRTDFPNGLAMFLVPMVAACSQNRPPPDRTPSPVAAHSAADDPCEEARKLVQLERTLPDTDYDVQIARLDYAAVLFARDDLPGAWALQEKVLDVLLRMLPNDDPHLARARGDLARTLCAQGQFETALPLQEEALRTLERILPADHPDAVRARMELATTRSRIQR